ncbi:MAG: hypothetical protein HZA59_04170 [Hydrogenophilales bacterium]|nr:hypothetical protein [Hydrogenophilales bacterium]
MKTSAPGASIYVEGETKYKIDLRFKTDVGTERFVSPYFPMPVIKKLQTDGGAEIVYLDDNPYQVIFKGQQLPKGFLSLLLGLVSGVVGVYLIKIRHKLVPYTRYLRSDSSNGSDYSA